MTQVVKEHSLDEASIEIAYHLANGLKVVSMVAFRNIVLVVYEM